MTSFVDYKQSIKTMCISRKRPSFLVILFDSLEFDGRAQRNIDVINRFGPITFVDLMNKNARIDINSISNVDRVRVVLPLDNTRKIWRHLRLWGAILRVSWQTQPNVVMAENYFTIFAGWLAARLARSKLIYDAYELLIPDPDKRMTQRDRFWYLLERWTVRRADLIIAANKDRARLMAEHYGLKRIPTVVRNIPPNRMELSTSEEIIAQYHFLERRGVRDRLILYQGDIALDRGIGRFIQAFAFLPLNYRFVVVGSGPDFDQLRHLAKELEKQGRFFSMGRVGHRQLPAITALADVGIISYPFAGLNNLYCSPNKIFEYAQAGLPVVATNQPPLKRMVEAYGLGKLVDEHDSPQLVAEAIRQVAEKKKSYSVALDRFLTDHQWERDALNLAADMESVLNLELKNEL